MRPLVIITLIAFALASCRTNYKPETFEGSVCKFECARASCEGSSYSCDRNYNACVSSCKAMEQLQ